MRKIFLLAMEKFPSRERGRERDAQVREKGEREGEEKEKRDVARECGESREGRRHQRGEHKRERERDELQKGREREEEDCPPCAFPRDRRERDPLFYFSLFSLIKFSLKNAFFNDRKITRKNFTKSRK